MRATFLTMLVLVVAAGLAAAQGGAGYIGLYFEPDSFSCEDAHTSVGVDEHFLEYLTVIESDLPSIGGYEAGLSQLPMLYNVAWPYGGLNFGELDNQLVGYQYPLPVVDGVAVLATLYLVCLTAADYFPEIGPGEPASIPGFPVVADGTNPENLLTLEPTSCYWWPGIPGTAWIEAQVVATEARSFTTIKQLFR